MPHEHFRLLWPSSRSRAESNETGKSPLRAENETVICAVTRADVAISRLDPDAVFACQLLHVSWRVTDTDRRVPYDIFMMILTAGVAFTGVARFARLAACGWAGVGQSRGSPCEERHRSQEGLHVERGTGRTVVLVGEDDTSCRLRV